MNYTYLLINLALLVLSFILAFNKKEGIEQNWKFAISAALISGLIFCSTSFVFKQIGVLSFNTHYILGFYAGTLPVEQWVFCFVLPLTGISIYNYLNFKFPGNYLERFSLTLSNLLLGFCAAMLFFTYTKIYNLIIFCLLFLLLFYVEYINKRRFMYKFYRACLVSLLLFYPAYLLLTGLSQIYFYFMGLLLVSIYLFELFKGKAKN